MGYRSIDYRKPETAEQKHTAELNAFNKRANHQRWRDDREGHLEHEEDGFGNSGVWIDGLTTDTAQESLTQIAKPGGSSRKCQAVDEDELQNGGQTRDCKTMHHNRQYVLCSHKAGIKQRKTRERHEENKSCGRKNPGRIG